MFKNYLSDIYQCVILLYILDGGISNIKNRFKLQSSIWLKLAISYIYEAKTEHTKVLKCLGMVSKNGGKAILLDRWINHPDGRFRPAFQNKPVGMAPLLWIYRGQLKHPKKGLGIIRHWLCMLFPMRALFPWHTTFRFFFFYFFTPAFGSHNTKWKA